MELLEFVNKNLAAGEVTFAYRKKSGELRIARGTTSINMIPEESQPKGTGTEKSNVRAYWDLNANGWRAFNPLCVVWAQGCPQTALTKDELEEINKYLENN